MLKKSFRREYIQHKSKEDAKKLLKNIKELQEQEILQH